MARVAAENAVGVNVIKSKADVIDSLSPRGPSLRFWNNMSIAQIAENLNLSYSATAVRLFRVLRALREAMQ